MKTVNVQALKAKEGKPQHMVAGKVYQVSEQAAKNLLKNKQAVKASGKMEPGKIYPIKQKD